MICLEGSTHSIYNILFNMSTKANTFCYLVYFHCASQQTKKIYSKIDNENWNKRLNIFAPTKKVTKCKNIKYILKYVAKHTKMLPQLLK